MNRLTKYAIFLAFCKLWDLYSTWLCTPTLSREMNPVTTFFGLHWLGVIIFQIITLIITLFIVRRSIRTDSALLPNTPGLTPLQVTTWVAFGDLRSGWNLLWSFGASFDRRWYYFSGLLLFTEPIAHLFAGMHNLASAYITSYMAWTYKYPLIKAMAAIVFVVALGFCFFAFREFAAYRVKPTSNLVS